MRGGLPGRPSPVRSLLAALEATDGTLRAGGSAAATIWPTGFTALDLHLDGGLRAGELTLLGGSQGLGKTTFVLQLARAAAVAGREVLYLCFEHREQDVVARLLSMELGLLAGAEAVTASRVRRLLGPSADDGGLVERLAVDPVAVQALAAVTSYAPRLHLATVGGRRTTVDDLQELAAPLARPLVVVDYLQKVRPRSALSDEAERVTEVVEGLKDLALQLDVPVLAVVASDRSGLSGRTRLRDLRGSTALAYEADVALLLNDKHAAVARHHLMYGATNADSFHQWVVCSIEKNRSGADGVDLEFQKHFDHGHFDPHGQIVSEQLVDDRIHTA